MVDGEHEKQVLVNKIAARLVQHLATIDPAAAKRLKDSMNLSRPGEVWLYSPRTKNLKKESFEQNGQRVVSETKGMTTTYYAGDVPVSHFITVPNGLFERDAAGRLAINMEKLTTLIHELLGHTAYPEAPARTKEAQLAQKLRSEVRADVITVRTLYDLGLKEEANLYLQGRQATRPMREALVRKVVAQNQREIRRRQAEEMKRYQEAQKRLLRVREQEEFVNKYGKRLLPKSTTAGAKRWLKGGNRKAAKALLGGR